MAAFITKKQSLILLTAGLCTGIAAALLLCWFSAGVRLGPLYDFLLKHRQKPPVSGEITLIETGTMAESPDVFDALSAAGEFNVSGLLIEVPVLGISSDRNITDDEISRRLNDEYTLLGRNIRNLFDAIRMGSVNPAESGQYVDNLVDLANRGRDRLSAFLLRSARDDSISAFLSDKTVFPVLEAANLHVNFDADGVLRRIAPIQPVTYDLPEDSVSPEGDVSSPISAPPEEIVSPQGIIPHLSGIIKTEITRLRQWYTHAILPPSGEGTPAEHVVYQALKSRWPQSGIKGTVKGLVLTAGDASFPLDNGGNIIIEKPSGAGVFRSIGIDRIRAYADADRSLRRLLKEAEAAGVYANVKPERIPLYLYDYAKSLQDDFVKDPSPEKHAAWLQARREYWSGLDEFMNGSSVTELADTYADIITTESLNSDSLEKLRRFRNDLIISFARLREKYLELSELHNTLAQALGSSFCIMGPPYAESPVVESSALLANTLLTGRCVNAAGTVPVILWSLLILIFVLCAIHALRPFLMLVTGTIAALICAAAFSLYFIKTGYWLEPGIPALALFAGTAVMFTAGALIRLRMVRHFRIAYGGAVNKSVMRQLLRTGQPVLREIHAAGAAVVVVKDVSLFRRENNDTPVNAAKAAAEFRMAVTQAFFRAGATLTGCEGDTVIVCFGSPLERIWLSRTKTESRYGDDPGAHSSHHPAIKAAGFISELIPNIPPSWRFGMDFGECAFGWTKETGYTANGAPLVRARILASLASRYNARILITNTIRENLNRPARKLHSLRDADGSVAETFYELPV
ncbi:MAG: hypothetical protein FWF29_01315 [Treponema sp.]|nr:hypothetical protein [Treponema sp.]